MSVVAGRRTRAPVDVVPVTLSVLAIAVLAYVVARRIGHPYELEWLEGGAVDHVRRLLHGRPIYQPPSVDYVAYTYPPFYWVASAAVAFVTGTNLFALRLVSTASAVGTLAVLAVTGRRHGDRWSPGIVAAGIYAASFGVTGSWFDVARVDSLYVFLGVAALALADRARTWRAGAAAGVVGALAIMTKQPALLVVLVIGVWLMVRRGRVGVAFLAGAGGVAGVVSISLQLASHGWYRFITGDVLAGHDIERDRLWSYWTGDLIGHLWPSLLIVAAAAIAVRRFRGDRQLLLVGATALVLAGWPARFHTGGSSNNLMPAFAAVALLVAVSYGCIEHHRMRALVAGAAVVQLLLLRYPIGAQLPDHDDKAAGRALISALRQVDGDVLVVSHPEYAVLAGKSPHAQAAAISDVLRSHDAGPRQELRSSIAAAVHERRFAAIVFDGADDHFGFPDDFGQYYTLVPSPTPPGPTPVDDEHRRPSEWWVPVRG